MTNLKEYCHAMGSTLQRISRNQNILLHYRLSGFLPCQIKKAATFELVTMIMTYSRATAPWALFYKQTETSCSILAFQNYFLYKISPDDSDAAETPDSSKPETVPETGEPVKLKLTIKKDDVGSQWMIRDVPVLKKRGRKRFLLKDSRLCFF